jgi:antitoxin (DNA-binding transcriptional repressor) of toxin-antitoxin stability system
MQTRTIPAGEFKAKCLALMDEIALSGEEIVITKRGKPVARLKAERPLGRNEPDLRGTILYEAEDAWEPLGIEWFRPGKFDDSDDDPE